jgi:hypothetical protein
MNEHVMLEIARQRTAEWQESARLARLARLAREQRAADRARRGRRRGGDRGVPALGGGPAGLPPVPDYVDGTFATDRKAASAGRAAARR